MAGSKTGMLDWYCREDIDAAFPFQHRQGGKQLKISRALMTSAALLSAVLLLAGCGHGLINRLI
ncbi:hypothetical protein ASD99_25110 [Mesorhizobium sp. Root695]|jgi:hypothetical protein|nr:hypothetical protein ASD12_03740 [Mesorhizobium sp. Root102]KRB29527.1 hypothetical protein ASD99_25110 [Mesorhizobium sp. Root695]